MTMSNRNTVTLLHLVNMAGLLGISATLIVAFYYQFIMYELPCPLCLLQRAGLMLSGAGFLFNLRYGTRNVHYSMVIMGSVLTGIMASRQMFLHILPGDSGYGSAFLGLHFYTWALVASVLIIFSVAIMMSLSDFPAMASPVNVRPVIFHLSEGIFIVLIAACFISTVLECGGGQCADNPVSYELLSR